VLYHNLWNCRIGLIRSASICHKEVAQNQKNVFIKIKYWSVVNYLQINIIIISTCFAETMVSGSSFSSGICKQFSDIFTFPGSGAVKRFGVSLSSFDSQTQISSS